MLWSYGGFAAICHAVAVLFSATMLENATSGVYFNRFFPMIEYSIVAFIAVLGGVVAIEYIEKAKRTDP